MPNSLSPVPLLLAALALGCAPTDDDDDDAPTEADSAVTELESPYALGWPVDACSLDFPEKGTGHAEGDVLPQYEMSAQTEERVQLHNFCNHVVYIEFGYWT
ncbi:hypothetical protein LBMAG42_53970 [Deltaproteobacteria bacterium]|nr:hypothetical protein LBMAG42_53970 [Deltaproteobacteria bacterium]